jgi:hypothetical protein
MTSLRAMPKILKSMLILALGATLWPQSALAGSNSATLSCKSKPGQAQSLTLQGKIPDSEETLDLTLADRKHSLKLTNSNAEVYRIEAFEQGMFSLIIKHKEWGNELKLYAIPKTVKATKKENSTMATFDAMLESPKPQVTGPLQSPDDMLRKVRLTCSYKYEV